ncbi:MAG: hypothetical protein JRD89_00310 [Deltaproteobacteria bacterium]|nr:hypothetical protein [Deltaproteobacteria bacterium]
MQDYVFVEWHGRLRALLRVLASVEQDLKDVVRQAVSYGVAPAHQIRRIDRAFWEITDAVFEVLENIADRIDGLDLETTMQALEAEIKAKGVSPKQIQQAAEEVRREAYEEKYGEGEAGRE